MLRRRHVLMHSPPNAVADFIQQAAQSLSSAAWYIVSARKARRAIHLAACLV
jgi:hypothetical protein